jgi:hypothetical protein
VVGALALALALPCCQQILSIDGTVVVAGPGDACGLGVDAGACQACLTAQCCDQAASCARDLSCASYESCLLSCGAEYACRSTCVRSNPIGGAPNVSSFDQCLAGSCADPCGVSCGVAGSYTTPDAADGCQACINAHICTASENCATDTTCEMQGHCAFACATPDCQSACLAGDAGLFLSAAYGLASTCLAQCQVGNDWACVGNVTWPLAKQKTIDATVTVLDSAQDTPLPGVQVAACNHGDVPCSSPQTTAATDAKGQAHLVLTSPPGEIYGFQGYFDLTSPGQSLVHYLYFLPFPLSEPQAQLQVISLAPSSLQALVSLAHITLDPNRGHVAVSSVDCLLILSSGVTFTAQGTDSQTQQVYYQGGALGTTATSTDQSGLVFFFNVPPGPVHIEATPLVLGRVSSRVDLVVQAGAISFAEALPTP